jgi:hypothetical protein
MPVSLSAARDPIIDLEVMSGVAKQAATEPRSASGGVIVRYRKGPPLCSSHPARRTDAGI